LDANFTKEKPKGFPWVAAIALLVAGTLLYRLASGGKGFDVSKFTSTLENLDPLYSALAILFIILSYAGRAVRWEVMMRPLRARVSFARMLTATLIGFTAVVLLGRAGEFVRPWLIARESKTGFPAQMAIWFFERIYDLLVVILFFGYGLVYLGGTQRIRGAGQELAWIISSGGWVALGGGAVCLCFIFALRFLSPSQRQGLTRVIDWLPPRLALRLRPLAGSFLEGAAASCDGRLQWKVILYTILEWLVIAICQWSIFQAFPVTAGLSFSEVVTIVGLVSFGAVIQLPGIGGGMQVAAVAVLTQLFGIGLEEATSVALVLWVCSFLLVVPAGVWLALREGIKFNQMRRLQ
jgi:hypothetical protein